MKKQINIDIYVYENTTIFTSTFIYIYIYMNICVNVFKVNKHELYNDFDFSYFH